jgi:hypothetical protein
MYPPRKFRPLVRAMPQQNPSAMQVMRATAAVVPPPAGGAGCAPVLLPPSYRYIVRSLSASVWSTLWVPAAQRNGVIEGPGIIFSAGTRSLERQQGAEIHPGNTAIGQYAAGVWHHVSIAVDGELRTENGVSPDAATIDSTGWRASILKARITLMMGNSRQRSFDFDIGAGVEFDIKAQAVQSIEVLVPDPAGIVTQPDDVTRQVNTILMSTVYCEPSAGRHARLTYSQPFWITGAFTEWWMPVMPNASEVMLQVEDAAAAAVIARAELVDVSSGALINPTYGPPPTVSSYSVLGGVAVPPNSSSSPRVPLGQANAIRVVVAAPAPSVVNVVQILDV